MPTIKGALARIKKPFQKPDFWFAGTDWAEAERQFRVTGWDVESAAANYVALWKNGQISVPDTLKVPLKRALQTATQGKSRLSVLDFGGNLGFYYAIFCELLPEIEIEYTCFDLPVYVEAARNIQPDLCFVSDKSELGKFDFVFASGSLHYLRNWEQGMTELCSWSKSHLFISRAFSVLDSPSYLVGQRFNCNSWLGWCINRSEVVEAAKKSGFELKYDEKLNRETPRTKAPEQFHKRAFLFERSL